MPLPDVLMPRLTDSMEAGTILRWLKADGAQVTRGEEIVEIETDKAAMTYEADATGPLAIVAEEGATVPVGGRIASIDAEGGTARAAGLQRARERRRPYASPVARRLAARLGVALESVTGTGPSGRVLKADVAAGRAPSTAPTQDKPTTYLPANDSLAHDGGRGQVTIQALSPTQVIVARRMAESRATVPDFEVRTEVDMEAAIARRSELKDRSSDAKAPSLNDFVVRACALALRDFPRANGAYRDGRFELYQRVNVGVAVAAADALVVPTVFDADHKSLETIAEETRALTQKVRSGTITPSDLSGGTFTVSNLGMYGVTSFTAVINPPQAAILAVGGIIPRPVVRDGAIVVSQVMDVTLACDHRILYGADAARFLARVRERLENLLL
ncbi:MAG: dihydrolipoamide acetyltransferase family protein [Candidatus Dormibacteria bacterium]